MHTWGISQSYVTATENFRTCEDYFIRPRPRPSSRSRPLLVNTPFSFPLPPSYDSIFGQTTAEIHPPPASNGAASTESLPLVERGVNKQNGHLPSGHNEDSEHKTTDILAVLNEKDESRTDVTHKVISDCDSSTPLLDGAKTFPAASAKDRRQAFRTGSSGSRRTSRRGTGRLSRSMTSIISVKTANSSSSHPSIETCIEAFSVHDDEDEIVSSSTSTTNKSDKSCKVICVCCDDGIEEKSSSCKCKVGYIRPKFIVYTIFVLGVIAFIVIFIIVAMSMAGMDVW